MSLYITWNLTGVKVSHYYWPCDCTRGRQMKLNPGTGYPFSNYLERDCLPSPRINHYNPVTKSCLPNLLLDTESVFKICHGEKRCSNLQKLRNVDHELLAFWRPLKSWCRTLIDWNDYVNEQIVFSTDLLTWLTAQIELPFGLITYYQVISIRIWLKINW
jgi:hypothetical protein